MNDRERSYTESCPYCPGKPVLASFGHPLYPYRQDFHSVWICPLCKAFVGCHKGGNRPKGFLANDEYKELRKIAHALFDPIWKKKEMKRWQCYKRMAEVLGIPPEEAHISQLSIEQLHKLIRSLRKRNLDRSRSES